MSEEKKLTDEELIHDLEEFERDIDINETGLYTKILDLIRRLQYDNSSAHKASDEWREKYETLKNELKKELTEHEEFTKKVKAEIERLTEENKQEKVRYENEMIALADGKDNKIIKLQKQLDKEYERGYMFGKQNALTAEKLVERAEQSETSVYRQAVKDTAKEIYRKAEKKSYFKDGGHYDKDRYLLDLANLKEIVNGYGVEVEG